MELEWDEAIHWSQALSSVLRYEPFFFRPAAFEAVVPLIRVSRRFGSLSSATIEGVLLWDAQQHHPRFSRLELADEDGSRSPQAVREARHVQRGRRH